MRYFLDTVDPLVALDLADLLRSRRTDAVVVEVGDLSELGGTDRDIGRILISDRDATTLRGESRVRDFIAGGGAVVTITAPDGPKARASTGWVFVEPPYTDDQFLAALDRALA